MNKSDRSTERGREGYVLVSSMVFVGVLTIIAAVLTATVMPEMHAARYHRDKRESFYHAEAVAQYTLMCINTGLSDGTLDLEDEVEPVDFELPDAIEGDPVTELTRLPNGTWYRFTAIGRSGRSTSVIEVSVRRPSLLATGVFGDREVDLKPHYEIFSYNSTVNSSPDRADSTGEVSVGVNDLLSLGPGVFIDGQFMVGTSEFGEVPFVPAGYISEEVDRMEADPLGIHDGILAQAFTYYSDAANNDNAAAGITDDKILIEGSFTFTGGRYYLESIDFRPSSTLNIVTEPGDPVIIYLNGDLNVHPNSRINMAEGQRPADFFIFSRSTSEIKILPNADFQGMVYAPYADLVVQPSGKVYGVFWAGTTTLQPGGELYIDTSLLNRFPANYVVVEQWNQLR